MTKKVEAILENPEHYKPLRGELKCKRRAHVGPYVILCEIVGNDIVLLRFEHHDKVYNP